MIRLKTLMIVCFVHLGIHVYAKTTYKFCTEKKCIKFDSIKQTKDKITFVVPYVNQTNKITAINKVYPTCGCTKVGYSRKPIPPAHSTNIYLTCWRN